MAWLHWKNCEYLIRLPTGSVLPRLLIAVIAEVLMISGRRKNKRGSQSGIWGLLLGLIACMHQRGRSDLKSKKKKKKVIYLFNLHKEACCWLPLTPSGHLWHKTSFSAMDIKECLNIGVYWFGAVRLYFLNAGKLSVAFI